MPRAEDLGGLKRVNWGLKIHAAAGLASFPAAPDPSLAGLQDPETDGKTARPFLTTLFKMAALPRLLPHPHLAPLSSPVLRGSPTPSHHLAFPAFNLSPPRTEVPCGEGFAPLWFFLL